MSDRFSYACGQYYLQRYDNTECQNNPVNQQEKAITAGVIPLSRSTTSGPGYIGYKAEYSCDMNYTSASSTSEPLTFSRVFRKIINKTENEITGTTVPGGTEIRDTGTIVDRPNFFVMIFRGNFGS